MKPSFKFLLPFYLLLFLFCKSLKAQDTIVFNNDSKVIAKDIVFVNADVKYKLFNDTNGTNYYANKSSIFIIRYKDNIVQFVSYRPFSYTNDTIQIKPRKNFMYVNILSLVFNSELNISYERRFKNKIGVSLYGACKFANILGRGMGSSGIGLIGDAVRFSYQGPRAILGFKYYTNNQKYFAGLTIGGSDLKIKNKSFYGSSSSYAQQITDLNSTRYDLDIGLTFGVNNLFKRFQVYATLGLRNIWVTSTCVNRPGSPSVGGELAPFTAPIVNGYIGCTLYQFGINYVFPPKKSYPIKTL